MNPFRRSVIKGVDPGIFRNRLPEKKDWMEKLGNRGMTRRQMDKELRDAGYKPDRRKIVMEKILGKKQSGGLTKEQIEANLRYKKLRDQQEEEKNMKDGVNPRRGYASKVIEARKERAEGKGLYENPFGIKIGSTGFAGTQNDGGQQSSHASTDVHPPV